jgi:PAS domain-containing protein
MTDQDKPIKQKFSFLPFWMSLFGFLTGLVFLLVAIVIQLVSKGQYFSITALNNLHVEFKALIWFDLLPFFLAFIFGLIAKYHNELNYFIAQWERLVDRHNNSVTKLNVELKQKEDEKEKIRYEKQQWESAIDAVEDIVILVDIEGQITHCNLATPMTFRTSFDEFVGHPVEELFPGIKPAEDQPLPNQVDKQFPGKEGRYNVITSALLIDGIQQGLIYVLRNLNPPAAGEEEEPFLVEREAVSQPIEESDLESDEIIEPPILAAAIIGARETDFPDDGKHLTPIPDLPGPGPAQAIILGEAVHAASENTQPTSEEILINDLNEPPELPDDDVMIQPTTSEEWKQTAADTVSDQEIGQNEIKESDDALALKIAASAQINQHPLTEISKIQPVYIQKLSEVHILTTGDLLTAGSTRKGREELVALTGIPAKEILSLVNTADLLRVTGLNEESIGLLSLVGVNTVRELSNRSPQYLFSAMSAVQEEKQVANTLPSLSDVEGWVEISKGLTPLVSY